MRFYTTFFTAYLDYGYAENANEKAFFEGTDA